MPTSQSVHVACALLGWYWPAAQLTQMVAPAEETLPEAHGAHGETPRIAAKVPGVQAAQLMARGAAEDFPGKHAQQLDAAEAAWYRPAAQFVQAEAPVAA